MGKHIFISYSKKDKDFAWPLADALEKAGFDVWIDREITGGSAWRDSIDKAVQDAGEMIVVLSPNAVASKWVMHEGSVASALGKKVYPILYQPVPPSDFPVWMEELQYIDFTTTEQGAAFRRLVKDLTPPNPLQDLLDREVEAYREHGALIGEARLRVFDESAESLTLSAEAAELLAKSRAQITQRRRLFQGGVGAVAVLMLLAALALVALAGATASLNDAAAQGTALAADADLERTANAIDAATSEAQLADVSARSTAAVAYLTTLFEELGLVLVGNHPFDLTWGDDYLWVLNRYADTVQQIDPESGLVVSTLSICHHPLDLIWDGGDLWVSCAGPSIEGDSSTVQVNPEDGVVMQIDPALGQVVNTFPVGWSPYALAWDGSSLWVAHYRGFTVTRHDPVSGEVTASIEVGPEPVNLVWDGTSLWVANSMSGSVMRIDPAAEAVVADIAVSNHQVGSQWIELAWDGSYIWASISINGDWGVVVKIDPASNQIVMTIPIEGSPGPLLWDGASLWVINGDSDVIHQIDPAAGTVVATLSIGTQPSSLAWENGALWVSDSAENRLRRINLANADFAVLDTIPVGDEPSDLAWDGERLWVVNHRDDTVMQIDVVENGVVDEFPVGSRLIMEDQPLAIAANGDTLWLANVVIGSPMEESVTVVRRDLAADEVTSFQVNESPINLIWGGDHLWAARAGAWMYGMVLADPDDDFVIQLDPSSGQALATIPVEGQTASLAWDGANLWVAVDVGQDEHELMQIDPASGDVMATILIPGSPAGLAWDGSSLWAADWNNNVVMQIDPISGQVVATVPVGHQPSALAWDGEYI